MQEKNDIATSAKTPLLNPKELSSIYCELQGSTTNIPQYKDDPDSIGIENAFKVDFRQYVGETDPLPSSSKNKAVSASPLNQIFALLKNENRLMLQANAGTGKSSLILRLVDALTSTAHRSPDLLQLNKIGINKVLILEPTTAITEQLRQDFTSRGLSVPALDNQANRDEIRAAQDSEVVICCYDSLMKIEGFINSKTLIVVDEFHQLVVDYDFRNKERFNYLIEQIYKGRLLFMSATPLYYFCLPKNLSPYFGFKLVVGVAQIQQKVTMKPTIYQGRRKDVPAYLLSNYVNRNELLAVKFDSVMNLGIANDIAKENGFKSDMFTSKKRENKEGNKNYQSLMKNGTFEDRLNVIWFTTLLEAGVSIKEEIKNIVLVDVNEWNRAIQLMSRARYNHATGVNKNVSVVLLETEESRKKERPRSLPVIQRLYNKIGYAKHLAGVKEQYSNGELSTKLFTDTENERHYTITKEDGKEAINLLWILHKVYKESQQVGQEMTLKRIARFDNRVSVAPVQFIEVHKDPQFEAIREQAKAKEEQDLEALKSLLTNDHETLIHHCYKQTRDEETKENLWRAFPFLDKKDNISLEEFRHKNNLKSSSLITPYIKDIAFLHEHFRKVKLLDIIRFTCNNDREKVSNIVNDIKAKNRRFRARYSKKDISRNDRLFYEREQVINKKLGQLYRDLKRGQAKEWRTAKEWADIVNKALLKQSNKNAKITQKKAMETVKFLYEVEEKRTMKKGKRSRLYKLSKSYEMDDWEQLIIHNNKD